MKVAAPRRKRRQRTGETVRGKTDQTWRWEECRPGAEGAAPYSPARCRLAAAAPSVAADSPSRPMEEGAGCERRATTEGGRSAGEVGEALFQTRANRGVGGTEKGSRGAGRSAGPNVWEEAALRCGDFRAPGAEETAGLREQRPPPADT